ncbi:MAG: universal stress protein, partial [Desulfohalobium sp.]
VVRPMRPTDLDMIWETLTEEQRIHLQGLRLGTSDTTAGNKEGEKRIQVHAKALRDHLDEAYEQVNVTVTFGDPGEEIAKHADELGVDLIVMPSHGRRGVKHLLLGSVAERVLRYAHCPVLVLR